MSTASLPVDTVYTTVLPSNVNVNVPTTRGGSSSAMASQQATSNGNTGNTNGNNGGNGGNPTNNSANVNGASNNGNTNNATTNNNNAGDDYDGSNPSVNAQNPTALVYGGASAQTNHHATGRGGHHGQQHSHMQHHHQHQQQQQQQHHQHAQQQQQQLVGMGQLGATNGGYPQYAQHTGHAHVGHTHGHGHGHNHNHVASQMHGQHSNHSATHHATELSRTNIYIRNVPNEWTTTELHAHFMRFGPIASAYIMQDPSTGVSRGVGFVRYEANEMAQAAVNAMNNFTPEGSSKALIVKFAACSRNNARDAQQQQQQSHHQSLSHQHQMHPHHLGSSAGGYASNTGSSSRNAMGGNTRGLHLVTPMGVNVNPAAAAATVSTMAVDHVHAGGAAPVRYSHTNIYVADLPTTMGKEEVDELFSKYGEISSSTLLVDPSSNEPRGVAMVRFAAPEFAAAAIEALNGHTLSGSTKPLQVRYAKVGGNKVRAQAQVQALAQQSFRSAYNPAVAAPVILTGQPAQGQQQQFYSYSGATTTYPPAQYAQPMVTQGYPGMAPAPAHGQAFYPQYAPAPQFYAAAPAGPTGAPQVVAAQAVVPMPITSTVPSPGSVAVPSAPVSSLQAAGNTTRTK